MESQIICKVVGISPRSGEEILEFFGVQPDNKSYPKYFCDVAYLVDEIREGKKFYAGQGQDKAYTFINHNDGYEFVQTKKDETQKDNLWSLPDCIITEYDYIRKGKPKSVDPTPESSEPASNSYPLQKLLRYVLPALGVGILLPILYCMFFGNCRKPCPEPTPCPKCDSCEQIPCPSYDKLFRATKVNFKFKESDTLNINPYQSGMDTLKKYSELLRNDSHLYVDLVGYTDYKGGETYNQKLSAKREKSIRDYFIEHGVDSTQIQIQEAFGKRFAVNKADSVKRAEDRKVVIRLFGLRKITK